MVNFGSRGMRNNNPGNIRLSGGTRWLGEVRPSRDRVFCSFETLGWGYRAMFQLLFNYVRRYGLDTVRGMIMRWAPPSENDTESYVRFVCDRAEIGPDDRVDPLDRAVMTAIVGAMAQMENGPAADLGGLDEGWKLFLAHLDPSRR